MTVSVKLIVIVPLLSRLQSASETLPDTLVFPGGQLVQKAEPVDTAYLPGSQLLQVAAPNAGATVPGTHLVQTEEPSLDENVPTVQSEHASTDADPSVGTYVPPAQAVLSLEPPAHQNPAGHTAPSADRVAGGQYLPAATVQSCLS